MKVAIYARVSMPDQTPEPQLTALRRYCEVRGWTILEEFVDVASGATADRPALARMMEPKTLRRFECVLVWKFDRLFRSVRHMTDALDDFQMRGIQFVSITECIDTNTAAGRMLFTISAAFAEFERDLIRERTRAGVRNAMAKGKHVGRPRVTFDLAELRRLKDEESLSYRQISAKLGNISPSKIHALLRAPVLKQAGTVCER